MRRFPLFPVLALAASLAAQAAEWQELFDGETLEGWTVLPGKNPEGAWVIEDRALKPEGKPGGLATQRTFGDFELIVEWKTALQGNSGIFYRVPPDAQTATEYGLNGVKVATFEIGSKDWDRRGQASKFENPAFGMAPEGRIVLQDHGQAVWFRAVKLRPR